MLLDRSQIEQWADTYNAKGDFPLLVQKLVYASTPELTKCNLVFKIGRHAGKQLNIWQ